MQDTTIDGLDMVSSIRLMGGNKALYHSTLVLFLDKEKAAIQNIRALLLDNPLEAAESAHFFKGSLSSIGANQLIISLKKMGVRKTPVACQFSGNFSSIFNGIRGYSVRIRPLILVAWFSNVRR